LHSRGVEKIAGRETNFTFFAPFGFFLTFWPIQAAALPLSLNSRVLKFIGLRSGRVPGHWLGKFGSAAACDKKMMTFWTYREMMTRHQLSLSVLSFIEFLSILMQSFQVFCNCI